MNLIMKYDTKHKFVFDFNNLILKANKAIKW